MKENLSAIRLLHFLGVAFLVARQTKQPAPKRARRGRRHQEWEPLHSGFLPGRGAERHVNLFVAVERPGGIERVILDCAAILLIAWFATMATPSMKSRLDLRQLVSVGHAKTGV